MAIIQWDDSFSVGVAEIDKQHQLLVRYINELYDALAKNRERALLAKLIDRLNAYSAIHFAREEHLFETFNFPESEEHKKIHVEFEDKVAGFASDFSGGRADLSMELMNFLADWLVHHIKGSDMRYGRFLNERGIN